MGEEPEFDEYEIGLTPSERLALAWYVTRSIWAFHLGTNAESEFRRDVARVIRDGS
jgi:hypothetical protein